MTAFILPLGEPTSFNTFGATIATIFVQAEEYIEDTRSADSQCQLAYS